MIEETQHHEGIEKNGGKDGKQRHVETAERFDFYCR